jgi:CRP-like cAMP-binding protein
LYAGEVFGEMAAINDAPRSASIVAQTASRLLRVPALVYQRCILHSNLRSSLPELWHKRSQIERVTLLADSSVSSRNRLAECAQRQSLDPGTTLIREGSHSDTVYILVDGRVQVCRGHKPVLVDGAPVILASGQIIGEAAPFLRQARNASVHAVDACEVLAIRGSDFKSIVQDSPQLFSGISQIVRRRRAA